MAFNIGNMRSRVLVQRRGVTQDALGAQGETWSLVSTVWVDIQALTGRELQAAQAVRATDTHKIILWYLAGLTPKDRIVYTDPEGGAHYYNITDVIDPEKQHRYMECTATEGLAVG